MCTGADRTIDTVIPNACMLQHQLLPFMRGMRIHGRSRMGKGSLNMVTIIHLMIRSDIMDMERAQNVSHDVIVLRVPVSNEVQPVLT